MHNIYWHKFDTSFPLIGGKDVVVGFEVIRAQVNQLNSVVMYLSFRAFQSFMSIINELVEAWSTSSEYVAESLIILMDL